MGSQLKLIVDQLNLLFPGKSYNVIAFDSFNPDQVLQVLSNVLTIIEARDEIDIRDESRDQFIKRVLNSLHILKYKSPGTELDLAQSLLLGDKMYILPILEWLLQQRPLLEKRAYLAKFLMKIEIPTILRGDSALEDLYENYEKLIEAFKDAHRERELLLSNNTNTAELRGDLSVMERERDIVAAKIMSHQKSRVDGSKSASALLSKVQALRSVRSKQETLIEQRSHLEASCGELERFVTRSKQQVTEARRAAQGVTPQGRLAVRLPFVPSVTMAT
ncbi:hypothetical protein B566_EDAN014236 [Ephemera danica]|nr:hypothetical protein B566_EDAN014236 [Ephemera danica]